MRVLIDCTNMRTGGALQNGLAFLAMAARHSGHEWHVGVSHELGEQLPSGWQDSYRSAVQIPRVESLRDFLRLARDNRQLEARVRPDVVFTLAGPPYWRARAPHVAGFAKAQYLYPELDLHAHLPAIAAWRTRARFHTRMAIHRRFFRRADHLVVQTETVRRRATVALDFPADRIHVARNSYSPLFRDAVARLRSTGFRKPATRIILVPSAYYVHKQLEIVPDTVQHLAALTTENFRVRLTLPPESADWQRLTALAHHQGVADRLETVGKIPHRDLAQQYLQADLVFLPTLLECSTAVYPEAMLAGVPVVTTDLDFARETCGGAAYYFNARDAADAAAQIARLLNDAGAWASLVAAGAGELARLYPSPEGKFTEQLGILESVADRHGVSSRVDDPAGDQATDRNSD